ncbi:MAG: bifunctional nuclease family protein [Bacteroidetes bacterium]|nr:bifunctional nuclease family protein [Bacteroidota bacterium]MBL0066582.1 bifunctional nuclease family protein [Bacteroidota bacterium]MBL0138764.1 bifunctional nuclease family protein [Bacteroidota bacterium]
MKKIKLEIIGLSYSQTQSGAYALVLGEEKGKRRLPIIIGAFEAQAIAIELENMTPTRPLTHDLFKSLAQSFDIEVEEVIIFNLLEGVFYAKLVCNNGDKKMEIDARTSDAIAIAVRFGCPIYTYEFILSTAGIVLEENAPIEGIEEHVEKQVPTSATKLSENELSTASTDELKEMLKKALDEEAYERASRIRDELNKRKSN